MGLRRFDVLRVGLDRFTIGAELDSGLRRFDVLRVGLPSKLRLVNSVKSSDTCLVLIRLSRLERVRGSPELDSGQPGLDGT